MHVHGGQPGQAAGAGERGGTAQFRILGPLAIAARGGSCPVPVGGPLPRRVLAVLIFNAGYPCPARWIARAVWDQHPPADDAGSVRTAISGLRRSLGTLRARLESADGGYLFRAAPEETDLGRFRHLTQAGREAWYGGDPGAAAGLLAAADRQWREPALADLPDSEVLRPARRQLARERADAQDLLADARILLGESGAVISELRATVAREPLREHAWAQLMRALHRSGQPDAALEAYRDARAALHQGHGMAPGPELAELRRLMAAGGGTWPAAPGGP
jgi:DNA-binding SARP family transcriptional activator